MCETRKFVTAISRQKQGLLCDNIVFAVTEEDEHTKSVLRQGRLQLAKLPGAPEGIADDPRKLEEFLNSMEENDNDGEK